ncbi:hypothetical protein KSZ_28600 [Dictyobacter formicarum]|uniref:Uncharacterized protein n=2 Tax=Dictyobacter formicarum TaxID=2778368 RepID=A0ABQ3VFC2_9CHLR|nr:hypothetical protein KSZ_28600 [Dictyobacter formicarum]
MLISGGFFGIAIIALVGLIFLVRHEMASTKARNTANPDNIDIQHIRSAVAPQVVEPKEQEKRRTSINTIPLPTVDVPNETAHTNTSGQIPIVQAPMSNQRINTGGQVAVEQLVRENEPAWLYEQIRAMEIDVEILTRQTRDFVRHIDALKLILIQLEQKQAEASVSIDRGKEEDIS